MKDSRYFAFNVRSNALFPHTSLFVLLLLVSQFFKRIASWVFQFLHLQVSSLTELTIMPKNWIVTFLLSFGLMSTTTAAFIGLNIGTLVSGQPPAPEIVNILKQNQITHVRLFNADPHLLKALSNTSIQVIIGVTNEQVLEIGKYPSKAASWINNNVAAYFPATNITAIAVGSEILTTNPKAAPVLVSAMNNLHNALVSSNLNNLIKVSSPQSMDIMAKTFPPSIAHFNSSFNSIVFQLLQFLKNTNSYFMLNAYPYYGFLRGNGVFPIEYALFEPLSPVNQIVDPNTLLQYDSMFDAMLDATYNSMAVLNFSAIPIVVTESGWPSMGGTDATIENAATFIKNLVLRVQNNSGPPSRPSVPINTYIYEMFDEENNRNWGVFTMNGSHVYAMGLSNPSKQFGNNNNNVSFSSRFCVARNGADTTKLQKGLNWACGQGGANCSAIQKGEACFNPNTINDHASYSYNDYYHKMISFGGDCDFDGTAMLTAVDPSHGSCIFKGSLNSSLNAVSPTSSEPVSPTATSSSLRFRVREILSPIVTLFAAHVILLLV